MKDLLAYLGVLSPFLTLAGVLVGGRMTRQRELDNWLRDQRQRTYFEHIAELHELIFQFATDKKTLKFTPAESGDPVMVWGRFQAQIEKLVGMRNSLRLIAGDKVSDRLDPVGKAIGRMVEVDAGASTIEAEWDVALKTAEVAVLGLSIAMRAELQVERVSRLSHRRLNRMLAELPQPTGKFDSDGYVRRVRDAAMPAASGTETSPPSSTPVTNSSTADTEAPKPPDAP